MFIGCSWLLLLLLSASQTLQPYTLLPANWTLVNRHWKRRRGYNKLLNEFGGPSRKNSHVGTGRQVKQVLTIDTMAAPTQRTAPRYWMRNLRGTPNPC